MKFSAIPVIGIPASHENVSHTEYNKTKQEVVIYLQHKDVICLKVILHINIGKLFYTHKYNNNKMCLIFINTCKIIYLQYIEMLFYSKLITCILHIDIGKLLYTYIW